MDTPETYIFGEATGLEVRVALKRARKTQRDLANLANVSESWVCHVLNGAGPSAAVVAAVGQLLPELARQIFPWLASSGPTGGGE